MDAEEFEQSVCDRAGIPPGSARVLIQATLQTLAERLSGGEARDLAAQLPKPMKEWLTPTSERAQSFGVDEFIRRVSDRAQVPPDTARQAARAVLTTVREAVTAGEFKDVMSQLPGEFSELAGP
jgi:uncharacterized protein (DUF2267 family)